MRNLPYYIINGITFYRLLSAPVLIIFVVYGNLEVFRWLLALSFFTDAIDGYLARRYRVTSIKGSRLDSIADDLTILAATVGMIVFKKDFIKEEIYLLTGLFGLFLLQNALAFLRYGKTTSFHTYAAKTAAIVQGIFLLLLFFLQNPPYFIFYMACFITGAELLEEILLIYLLPNWEADVKGIYWVWKKKGQH